MPNTPVPAAGEAMPKTLITTQSTRRTFLSVLPGLAAASAVPVALVERPANVAIPEPNMSPRERAEHHLEGLKVALELETGQPFHAEIMWDVSAAVLFGRSRPMKEI